LEAQREILKSKIFPNVVRFGQWIGIPPEAANRPADDLLLSSRMTLAMKKRQLRLSLPFPALLSYISNERAD
jgi:hypothetical protein